MWRAPLMGKARSVVRFAVCQRFIFGPRAYLKSAVAPLRSALQLVPFLTLTMAKVC